MVGELPAQTRPAIKQKPKLGIGKSGQGKNGQGKNRQGKSGLGISGPGKSGLVKRRNNARSLVNDRSLKRRESMLGLASFYSEDKETASGDRFDKRALTAAHPSLPFGTDLRVTNVRNGRSVTVRVNDRGPFVRGRIIDVTSAAAEALGMIEAGTTNVTLDIVRIGMPRRSSKTKL
jgi:rare lipoprotein A